MSDFPDSLFTPREVENREGVEYDAEKTKVFFAEDHNKATAEIVAIQEALGVGKVNMALDGWIPAGETWTYASATTFTITGDKTDKYQIGDKIKLTQTSVKYFYIVGVSYSSPNTTITVTGGSSYTVANATITSPNYSKQENPQGFPVFFNYTSTIGGFSDNSSQTFKFRIVNNTCQIAPEIVNGTSNATTITFTLPTVVGSNGQAPHALTSVRDNGVHQSTPGYIKLVNSSDVVTCYKQWTEGAFTASGNKRVYIMSFFYQI